MLVINGSGNTLASNTRQDITRTNDYQVKKLIILQLAERFQTN